MGEINFDIAAICILIFNLFLFFSRRRLAIPQTYMFRFLLFCSLGATVMDVVSVLTYQQVAHYPRWAIYAINTFFYLFQNAIAPIFCLFTLVIAGGFYRLRRHTCMLFSAPGIAAIVIILLNPLTHFVFSFDGNMRYSRESGLTVLYAISALYAVISLVSLARARSSIDRRTLVGLVLFLPFTLGSFMIQFFHSEVLVLNLGIALSELIILMSINDFDAFIDGQTGLFNRAGLAVMLEYIDKSRVRAAIFLVALENKDFLGYAVGPEASTTLERETIKHFFGLPNGTRFIARLDFGEYAYVLINPKSEIARTERERIVDRLSNPFFLDERRLALHARLCEIAIPEDATDALVVFQAHRALSLPGWAHPRDSWLSLSALSLARAGRQSAIVNALRRAIERSELLVHFQPIVSAITGEVVAAEALVRLTDEELGPIGPDEFIPIAERNGLIQAIGDVVVERSCAFLSSARKEGLCLQSLEVNLSPAQFAQSNLAERLLACVHRHGLTSSDLCFEVTETAAALSPLAMKRTIDALTSRGFAIAIDDFGTGNSNVLSLLQTPFTTVKLDRSLVVAASESEAGRTRIEALTGVFRKIGVTMIAEGVETANQLEILKSVGIEFIQGFYYSRSLPPDAFTAYLRERMPICT
jgi:EAL domain-containing protein (putative c-di-GMP-specific phosphodiesterase class I)/GGDEF domain-containing protein